MTEKILTVFVIAILCSSSMAVKLPSLRRSVKIMELIERDVIHTLQKHDNELSRQIQTLVSLSLREGQYDEIFTVLSELWDDLQSDRRSEITSWTNTAAALDDEITNFHTGMVNAQNARDAAGLQVQAFQLTVDLVNSQLAQLVHDIESVNNQILELDNQRRRDEQAFQQRQASHRNTLDALDIIVSDLEDIQKNHATSETLFQLDEVVERMKKLGNSNPLLSLVEFSTTFDPNTLQTVIDKLREIRANVANSGNDDEDDERRAKAQYTTLKSGMETQLTRYQEEQRTKKRELQTSIGLRDDYQETFDSEAAKAEAQLELKLQKMDEKEAKHGRHLGRLEDIDCEIETVEEAQQILKDNLGYAEEHMNVDESEAGDDDGDEAVDEEEGDEAEAEGDDEAEDDGSEEEGDEAAEEESEEEEAEEEEAVEEEADEEAVDEEADEEAADEEAAE